MATPGINVRIPQPVSLDIAIRLYLTKSELSNNDIIELFGRLSSATISRLKKKVYKKMIEEGTPIWNPVFVNTKVAYKTWGIDIDTVVTGYKTLKELGL